jgi:hypothetical protein
MHIWLVGLAALVAEAMPPVASELPLSLQIPAFLKALDFERNVDVDDSSLVISVVYDPNDRASVESKDRILAIQSQLTRLLVRGKRVVLEELPFAPGRPVLVAGVALTTALDEAAVEELSRYAQSAGVLTLATDPADVERGMVLGVESLEGKPRFVVNLAAARASGVSFEARFLNLCRIVEQ